MLVSSCRRPWPPMIRQRQPMSSPSLRRRVSPICASSRCETRSPRSPYESLHRVFSLRQPYAFQRRFFPPLASRRIAKAMGSCGRPCMTITSQARSNSRFVILIWLYALDADGDGNVTWGELRKRESELASLVLRKISIGPANAPCDLVAWRHRNRQPRWRKLRDLSVHGRLRGCSAARSASDTTLCSAWTRSIADLSTLARAALDVRR